MNISCFGEPSNARQSADSPHCLTVEPFSDVVLPISLLSAGCVASRQSRKHVSRHALRKVKEEEKPNAEDLVFASPRDRKGRWDWREAFNAAVERAGIKDFTFHDLRHCFGSHLGMNGTNASVGRVQAPGRAATTEVQFIGSRAPRNFPIAGIGKSGKFR